MISLINLSLLTENKITIAEFYDILFGRTFEIDYINQEATFKEIMDDYEIMIQRNIYKDPFFLCFKEIPTAKSLFQSANEMSDKYPYLKLRRYLRFGLK